MYDHYVLYKNEQLNNNLKEYEKYNPMPVPT